MVRWPGRVVRSLFALMLLVALGTALARVPFAYAQGIPDLGAVDAMMSRLMSMYDIPGAAVALIQNGKIIATRGYGYRDVAARAAVTEHTLFNIGSVTKSFTALGVAQLVDQGKLDLDVPVVRYAPELRLSDPQVTQTVTLRHLLSHTSGLPRADSLAAAATSRTQVIEGMAKIPVTAKPGERFQYCNQNVVLAGYVVERVTGQSWEAYTREHIFAPLGMPSAQFDEEMVKAPDFARPYGPDVLLGAAPIPPSVSLHGLRFYGPAGSIDASVVEMAQYALFQLGDGTFRGERVVSAKMVAEMHHGQVALKTSPEGSEARIVQALSLSNDMEYGLGWFTEEYRGVHLVQHSGETAGFTASVTLVPSAQAAVVVLTNATNASAFVDADRLSLVDWLLGLSSQGDIATEINNRVRTVLGFDLDQYRARVAAARAYKVAPAELARWAGDYNGPLAKVRITAANDRLLLRGASSDLGEVAVELIPFARDSYLVNHIVGIVVNFGADEDGVVTLYRNGSPRANRSDAAGRDGTSVDPRGKFRIMTPAGLRAKQEGNVLVIRPASPSATYILTSVDGGGAGLDTLVERFVARALPQYTQKVLQRRDLVGLSGRQFVYALPGGEILVVDAMPKGHTVFLMMVFGAPEAIRALTPVSNFVAFSYTALP